MVNLPVTIHLDKNRLRPEKSEVGRLLSDNTLAQQQLNWIPQVSLDEGLSLTIEWIRDNLEINRGEKYEI